MIETDQSTAAGTDKNTLQEVKDFVQKMNKPARV
jgi:hypothetical protein